jgi:hypothetical protein
VGNERLIVIGGDAAGMEEMINLDLGYAPPFSPVWDPVVIAARETAKKIQSSGG